ncbi:MAG TPA: helix-turn-helix transcriptional regulator [Melioribacteraceae bacterium]|nr:helix-turn-helix transcriptional regulator [Melioribacteraceae bacterium]
MDHLTVIALVICVAAGSAAIIHSVSAYRTYPLPELKGFILFIILYNSAMLLSFISQYILKNVSSLADWNTYLAVIVLMGLAGYTIYFTELFLITDVIHRLIKKEVNKFIKYSFGLIVILWILFYSAGTYSFFENGNKRFLLDLFSATNKTVTVIFLCLSIYLLAESKRQVDGKSNPVFKFGILFFSFAFIDTITIFLPGEGGHLISVLNGFYLNLVFLVCLKRFLILYSGDKSNTGIITRSSEEIFNRYNISLREKEVIEMIINGKSNKEIEEQLFISGHTVKNHIYNIFQKTGVKSRSQLIRLFINEGSIK